MRIYLAGPLFTAADAHLDLPLATVEESAAAVHTVLRRLAPSDAESVQIGP